VSLPPAAIVTDIEGTTTPIDFVHKTLFPYARARLAAFCAAHIGHKILADVPEPVLETLLGWMDRDEKITALKTVQGMIWEEGYRTGALKSVLYPDVPPALKRWSQGGLRLFVYSSGSVPAQKLLFGHSDAGDLTPLFSGFFDTAVGAKRDQTSYAAICRGANLSPGETLFLSDVAAELDAARNAGLRTCQLVRAEDDTKPCPDHDTAADFAEVARKFGLPRA
jgi:enolase-phosphatase E1